MPGMIESLAKAAVAVAIETPIAVVADVVTLDGSLSGKDESYTSDALRHVVANIKNAADPEK